MSSQISITTKLNPLFEQYRVANSNGKIFLLYPLPFIGCSSHLKFKTAFRMKNEIAMHLSGKQHYDLYGQRTLDTDPLVIPVETVCEFCRQPCTSIEAHFRLFHPGSRIHGALGRPVDLSFVPCIEKVFGTFTEHGDKN